MTAAVQSLASEPDVRVEHIDPARAHDYLGFNTHNRNLRKKVVDAYAADMRSGDWVWNGESIKFAVDGTLLDGQHRLAAIVQSDVAVPMLVIRDLPAATQETMDGGAKRKFSDVLKLRGETSYTTLAAMTRGVTGWENGERTSTSAYTNAQNLQTLEKHPWLRDGTIIVDKVARTAGLPASVGGLLWWLAMSIDPEDATFFFDRLTSAEDHHAGQPIYELRKAIAASSSVRGERSTRYLLAISIKAWNKYRDGETVGQLKFRVGGAAPEQFPTPR